MRTKLTLMLCLVVVLIGYPKLMVAQETGCQDLPDAEAFQQRGQHYADAENYQQAELDFTCAIRLEPNNASYYLQRGIVRYLRGQYAGASADYDQAEILQGKAYSIFYLRGLINYAQGEYGQAIGNYSDAIRLSPRVLRDDFYVERGRTYAILESYQKAIMDFTRALAFNPASEQAYLARGLTFFLSDDYSLAAADLSRYIEMNTDSPQAYYFRAACYQELERYEDAITDLDQAIRLNPAYAAAYHDRAVNYAFLDEADKAFADFERALKIRPDYAMVYHTRGVVYLLTGAFEQGEADILHAIELEPDSVHAFGELGQLYYLQGRHDEALAAYERYLELDGNAPWAIMQIVALKTNGGPILDHEGCDTALEVDQYAVRGDYLYSLNAYEEMIVNYSCSLELEPDNADSYFYRSIGYFGRWDYERAIADLDRVVALDTEFRYPGTLFFTRALCYRELERYPEALADFARAEAIDTTFPLLYLRRAELYQKQKDDRAALNDFRRYVELAGKDAEPWVLDTIDDLEKRLGIKPK